VVDPVVVALRVTDGKYRLDRQELIAADAAVDDLFGSAGAVKDPAAAGLHQRNWKWPVVCADDENLGTVVPRRQLVSGFVELKEVAPKVFVSH